MGYNDEIKDAVDWNVPTVEGTETIRAAINKMAPCNASALGVMANGKIIGIITDMDLMMSFDRGDDLDATQVTSSMTSCELLKGEKVKSPCVQLNATQSVANALGVLNRAGVHHLVVEDTENDRVGVASVIGLLKLAIK